MSEASEGGGVTIIDGTTWRDFVGSGVVVLMLGKTDCAACGTWTDELNTFLAGEHGYPEVRFGKMLLDQRGLVDFKREHGEWLKDVDVLPYNLVYKDGVLEKKFAGGGLERLTNRLDGVLGR